MSTFNSSEVTLNAPAERVFEKFSNLENLRQTIENIPADKIPEDKLKALEQLKVTKDTISFPAGPMGELTLRATELTAPTLIRLEGENSPVPLSITMHIKPLDAQSSSAYVEIDIKIPMMLAPMVKKPLQQLADGFSQLLGHIPF